MLRSEVGYFISITLAIVALLINWLAGETFQSNALNRTKLLAKALETENFASFVGSSLIILLCFFLWLVTAPFLFIVTPATVFASLSSLLKGNEFYRDVFVSLRELGTGMLISGSVAAVSIFVRQRFSMVSRVSDPLLQSCQLAPVAMLPNVQHFSGLTLSPWSVLCVATFTFYPFSSAFTGFSRLRIVPRLALATSEALPYGCAAFIFGEMWNAIAGIGFMMTVAGATYDLNRGLAGFFVLMLLFASIHIVLHCIAKMTSTKTA